MMVTVRTGGIGMSLEEPDCHDHVLAAAQAAEHCRCFFDHAGQWFRPDVLVEFEDHDVVHLTAYGLGWMADDHSVIFGDRVL